MRIYCQKVIVLMGAIFVCSCGHNEEKESAEISAKPLLSHAKSLNFENNIENKDEEIRKVVKLPPRWCSDVKDKDLCESSDTLNGSCKFDEEQNICKPKITRHVCANDDMVNPTGWGGYSPEDLISMDEPIYRDLRLNDGFEIANKTIVWLKNVEDNRCPMPRSCDNRGEALVTFLLEKKEGKKEMFSLVFSEEKASVVNLGGFKFKIATLIPYPSVNEIQEKEVKLAIKYIGIDSW